MSDADRSRAAVRLRDACVDGRLSVDELSERLETAYAARTIGELAPVLGDLAPERAQTMSLASWPLRAAALLIDGCIVAGGSFLAGLLPWPDRPLAGLLVSAPLALVYLTLSHGSERGQTVGDRVNGIVVRSDPLRTGVGGRLTHGQAFGRSVATGLFLCLFFVGGVLDFMWPLWDRRRQAWHDKLAGTIVVRKSV